MIFEATTPRENNLFFLLAKELLFVGSASPRALLGTWSGLDSTDLERAWIDGFIDGCSCGGCPIKLTELGAEYFKYLADRGYNERNLR